MKHNFSKIYKNVRIRPLTIMDLDKLREWRNNPKNNLYLSNIPYITSEMQNEWFNRSQEKTGEYVFAIDEISKLHRLVGSLSLYNIESKKAEFGKILIGDIEAHGNRVGVNATIALLYLGFNIFKLEEIYLHVYKDNIPAIKVYRKVGFKEIDEKCENGKQELIMSICNKRIKERI